MKDALGHGSDERGGSAAHQSGVAKIGTSSLARAAMADFEKNIQERRSWGNAKHTFADGSTVVASVQPRQQNSRGVRRGGHLATSWVHVPPGEKYGKRASFDKIKAMFGEK